MRNVIELQLRLQASRRNALDKQGYKEYHIWNNLYNYKREGK